MNLHHLIALSLLLLASVSSVAKDDITKELIGA